MSPPYFKDLSPAEQKALNAFVDSYSHNFLIKFVRLLAIEILNADANKRDILDKLELTINSHIIERW